MPFVCKFEQVFFKFRELPRSKKTIAVDDERRNNLGISVFARLYIEHEIDQRPFELCSDSLLNGKPSASKFCGAFQIQDVKQTAKLDVVFRRKIQNARG